MKSAFSYLRVLVQYLFYKRLCVCLKILIERQEQQVQVLSRHAQRLLHTAHIVSDFTCVYSAATGTIFGTTHVYELYFSYLSISIFTNKVQVSSIQILGFDFKENRMQMLQKMTNRWFHILVSDEFYLVTQQISREMAFVTKETIFSTILAENLYIP